MSDTPIEAATAASEEFPNPTRWYYSQSHDAEWWHRGGNTREEAIAAGRAAYPGEQFWICEAKHLVADCNVFDAPEIYERISDSDIWWEDGWLGQPNEDDKAAHRELEEALAATLRRHIIKHGSLTDGACLDCLQSDLIGPDGQTAPVDVAAAVAEAQA